VGRLVDWCRDAPGGGTIRHVRAAQGAFLLHAHTALAGPELGLRPLDYDAHAEAAHRLVRLIRDSYDDAPSSWPGEARGLRPRDFYLALASSELLQGRPEVARDLAEESLWSEGDDGEMRLLAGCAVETAALVRRQSEGHWSEAALRDAQRRFDQALRQDPSLLEARLRLGWVLVRRGWEEKAQDHLQTVAETPGEDSRRALAWLFLGRVYEKRGDAGAAVRAYRRALALVPHLQAAHIGLAHALEAGAGDEAARDVIGPFFLDRSRSWVRQDPWNDYPFGPPELRLRPFEELVERLCRR
jgi:tetratricopeptide (TPR) repeat protein